MRQHSLHAKLALPLLLAVAASPAPASEIQVESHLFRPNPSVDPDAKGRIELEIDDGGSEQKFDVRIERIDALGQTYTLWLEDPLSSGTLVDVGTFDPDLRKGDRADYERRTSRGQSLPLGVADLADLKDRALEVRDGSGAAILLGTVPDIGSGGSGGSGSSSARQKGESPLLRPSGSPISEAEGKVEAEQHGSESELEIETEHFDVAAVTYSVWIEDQSGVMQRVGDLQADRGRSDHGKIEWKTERGQAMPLGAVAVGELAGRRVEIRDPSDVVILEGQVPQPGLAGSNSASKTDLTATASGATVSAKGKVQSKWKASKGRYRLDVRAQARTGEREATLWIENPATGQLEQAADGRWTGGSNRNLRFRWRTDRSQGLPFGITDPARLMGQPMEIRDESGQPLLTGSL